MKAMLSSSLQAFLPRLAFLRLFILLPLLLLTACADNLFSSPFTVQFPANGKTYIGNQLVDFTILYNKPVTTADVFLNGTRISNAFNYGADSATAPIAKIRQYLKEGENILTVDPLAFGPTIKFTADTQGPTIIVKDGRLATANDTTTMRIKGELQDASAVSSLKLTLVKVTGINSETGNVTRQNGTPINIPVAQDNTFDISNVDVTGINIYSFEATDIHGFTSKKEYLANNAANTAMTVPNAIRVAVGDTLVKSLRPFIASSIYQGLSKAPIDVRNVCWDDPNKNDSASQNPNGGFCAAGQDGSTFPVGLNPVDLNMDLLGGGTAIVQRLYMINPDSTVLLNDFTVLPNDQIYINMDITHMRVELHIEGTALGFIPITVDMGMWIGNTGVDTDANVSAINKKMHVELVNSNISLENIDADKVVVWGIDMSGIAGPIVGALEGPIADLLPGILNPILDKNLQKLVIGGRMLDAETLTVPYFDWAVNVEALNTGSILGGADEMTLGLESWANVLTVDPHVQNQALGSIYVEDPINVNDVYNAKAEGTANLSVAVSSNAMNQAFATLYNAGLTHLTLKNGKVSYGADPAKPTGVKGDTRVRLYPESPPFFTLKSLDGTVGGAAEASIGYESAVLYLDKHDGTQWVNQLELGVSLKIAASIDQQDNVVKLGIHGSPSLTVNRVVNHTPYPVTKALLQTVVDAVLVYFVPTVNDNFLMLDMAKVAGLLNGTRVYYRYSDSSVDMTSNPLVKRSNIYSFTEPCNNSSNCVKADGSDCSGNGAGCYKHVCDTLNQSGMPTNAGGSLVCQTINFEVSTNTVSSIGNKGSNLFFQMQANEKGFNPPPGLPRFDMDNDGVKDYRDNCAVPQKMLESAVKLAGGILDNVNPDGTAKPGFEDTLKGYINAWIACDTVGQASSGLTSCGDYTADTPVAASGAAVNPSSLSAMAYPSLGNRNLTQWWDYMRKNDDPVGASLASDSYPWITMRYSNASQFNSDADSRGELCEDDGDRDGVYTDNGAPKDTCTSVLDNTNNPGQCTIDALDSDGKAVFVLFKNMQSGLCMTHNNFSNVPSGTGGTVSFPGVTEATTGADGARPQWAACNANDAGQHFYITVVDGIADRGVTEGEKTVYIYTNQEKQSAPGYYDQNHYHFLASTIANAAPDANSKSWQNDDIIVTGMPGYATAQNGGWRQWILSLSFDPQTPSEVTTFKDYPYLIESRRVWDVYGNPSGIEPGRRDCIFLKSGNESYTDADDGSCFPSDVTNRKRAAFQILLGPNMIPWTGRVSSD